MRTAFVLSGGGGLGAVQVGMLRALAAHRIVPDLIVGSSVGAINGAFFAGNPSPQGVDELDAIWRALKQSDIFPIDPRVALLGLLGRRDHLVSPAPLERLLRRHLGYERLEMASVPVHVVATEVTTGTEVVLSVGDAVRALLASAAIPGVFPPVAYGRHLLVDGGVVDNTPIGRAVALGADVVYVLPTEYQSTALQPPRNALGAALRALTVMAQERLLCDVERFGDVVRLRVVPPPATLTGSPIDFGSTAQLIDAAEETAAGWLDRQHRRSRARVVRVDHHDGHTTISLERSGVKRHGPCRRPRPDDAHRPPAA